MSTARKRNLTPPPREQLNAQTGETVSPVVLYAAMATVTDILTARKYRVKFVEADEARRFAAKVNGRRCYFTVSVVYKYPTQKAVTA